MTVGNVPLVDLQAQYQSIKPDIDAAIANTLESARFIQGPEVASFEDEFAAAVGAAHCVGVASGTAALMLALAACGIGPGDEVIMPAHTFAATGEAAHVLGATPVFVDMEPSGFGIDPQGAAHAVTARTKAIVPVHIYGHPAAMADIKAIADRHNLYVIEDAAQAHLATLDGTPCGAIGDLACFSFFPGKNLGAYGDAGAVTGNNAELIAKVRQLRDHGRSSKYVHEIVGYGERLDALQAAVLRVKLRHLADWTRKRNAVADRYRARLADFPFELPQTKDGAYHAYHLFVLQTDRRDALLKALNADGIGAGIHYPIPLHKQPAFRDDAHEAPLLPRVEQVADRILSLPIYPEMTEAQQDRVVDAMEKVVAQW